MGQAQQNDSQSVTGRAGRATHPPAPAAGRGLARAAMALAFLAMGALAGAVVVHIALERPALEAAQARLQAYEQDLAALRGHLEQANNTAASLEGRLLVEESTRRGLETGLQTMQAELGQARDSLAFYEQLMPPGPKGSISVRALDIERLGPHLRYRALLMRSGSNEKIFKGGLQFLAHGRQSGEKVTVPLSPALLGPVAEDERSDSAPAEVAGDMLAVEFADFQRSSGLLSLPPGFEPESVTMNVLEGRNVRASNSVTLAPVQP